VGHRGVGDAGWGLAPGAGSDGGATVVDEAEPVGRGRIGDGRFKSVLAPAGGCSAVAGRSLPPVDRSSFGCVHGNEFLRLTSHHTAAAPVIEERPGRYLGCFVNRFGEQLVFVHDDGDADATLFHGDVGWEPCRVTDAGGRPDAGGLILNDEERAFVIACWIATAWRREDAQAGRSGVA
jgi:hypothetical protein